VMPKKLSIWNIVGKPEIKIAGVGFAEGPELVEGNLRPPRLWQFDFAHCPELVEGRDLPKA
jgi:hypothetical protein